MTRQRAPDGLIRASDVGRYAYCARAWWLEAVRGVAPEPTRLAAGTAAHARHGRQVWAGVWLARLGAALVALAALLAAWGLLN